MTPWVLRLWSSLSTKVIGSSLTTVLVMSPVQSLVPTGNWRERPLISSLVCHTCSFNLLLFLILYDDFYQIGRARRPTASHMQVLRAELRQIKLSRECFGSTVACFGSNLWFCRLQRGSPPSSATIRTKQKHSCRYARKARRPSSKPSSSWTRSAPSGWRGAARAAWTSCPCRTWR